jgi:hypothetical protein
VSLKLLSYQTNDETRAPDGEHAATFRVSGPTRDIERLITGIILGLVPAPEWSAEVKPDGTVALTTPSKPAESAPRADPEPPTTPAATALATQASAATAPRGEKTATTRKQRTPTTAPAESSTPAASAPPPKDEPKPAEGDAFLVHVGVVQLPPQSGAKAKDEPAPKAPASTTAEDDGFGDVEPAPSKAAADAFPSELLEAPRLKEVLDILKAKELVKDRAGAVAWCLAHREKVPALEPIAPADMERRVHVGCNVLGIK